jgi:HNH endonuclease
MKRLPTVEEIEALIVELRAAPLISPVPVRVQFPAPQPQPTTALRGDVASLTFALYRFARSGYAPAAVQRLYDTFGSYRVKPKRGSRGVIWNNQPFWWSSKGYYRPGFGDKRRRRPLQHYIWEKHHGQAMPPMHEIFFRDRDRHNFAIDNLELLSKAELHKRTIELGETRVLGFEERSAIRGSWACRMSRDRTAILLRNFNNQPGGQSHGLIEALYDRKAA